MAIAGRSTNTFGFVHFGGEVLSGIEAGRGVRLPGVSTGSTPNIEPFGDETNIGITINGKGSGAQTFGGSSGATVIAGATVRLNSTSVVASTGLGIRGIYSTTFSWTNAAISSGQTAEVTLTSAVGSPNHPVIGDLVSISMGTSNGTAMVMGGYRMSTVGTSIVTIILANPGSTASTTLGSADGRIVWIDLT